MRKSTYFSFYFDFLSGIMPGNAHSYDHRLQQFDLLCAERNTKFSCIAYERSYGED